MSGWMQHIDKYWHDSWYGSFSTTAEYDQSFDSKRITNLLFGPDLINDNHIKVSGSRTLNRSAHDWLADYFYLPTDYESTVSFKPSIKQFLLDLNLYLSFNDWYPGLYLAFYAPLVHTRWKLNIEEEIINCGVNNADAGYYSAQSVQRGALQQSFSNYISGVNTPDFVQLQNAQDPLSNTISVVAAPLRAGIMSTKGKTKTRLADFRGEVGWNFLWCDDYHLGTYITMAAPTGNRVNGKYLFEPIAGDGHHFEIGGGITAHWLAISNEDESLQLRVYGNAMIVHLCGTRQHRTFDLKGKPFSRYMLVMKNNTTIQNALSGDNSGTLVTPSSQFNNLLTPLANISNTSVEVSVPAQAEITLMFNLRYQNWSFDIGYDFWARTADKCLKIRNINPLDAPTIWVPKGDASIFGYANYDPNYPAIALSASESNATIHSGTNFPATGTTDPIVIQSAQQNTTIDNPLPAFGAIAPMTTVVLQSNQDVGGPQVNTSVNPIRITIQDLELTKSPRAMSSKVFGHISYTWNTCSGWSPFFGIGGQAEFAHGSTQNICHRYGSISQWSLWIKGGISFE